MWLKVVALAIFHCICMHETSDFLFFIEEMKENAENSKWERMYLYRKSCTEYWTETQATLTYTHTHTYTYKKNIKNGIIKRDALISSGGAQGIRQIACHAGWKSLKL